MIICLKPKKIGKVIYEPETSIFQMAEASVAAFGSAIGVAIALAVVTFALRGKGHPEPLD
jgi:hypothetical protein